MQRRKKTINKNNNENQMEKKKQKQMRQIIIIISIIIIIIIIISMIFEVQRQSQGTSLRQAWSLWEAAWEPLDFRQRLGPGYLPGQSRTDRPADLNWAFLLLKCLGLDLYVQFPVGSFLDMDMQPAQLDLIWRSGLVILKETSILGTWEEN